MRILFRGTWRFPITRTGPSGLASEPVNEDALQGMPRADSAGAAGAFRFWAIPVVTGATAAILAPLNRNSRPHPATSSVLVSPGPSWRGQ
jgi:hypothetical protein